MAKILLVTKDKGPFNVTHKVVPVLRERGHNVSVVAEGLSAGLWEEKAEKLAFRGSVDFKKEPFEIDIGRLYSDIAPDVLVTTGSVPINLEQRFAMHAVTGGMPVPVVVIEDTVGAATRLKVTPNLVLTLNQLALDFYRTQGVLPDVWKKAIGSDYFTKLELAADTQAEVERLRKTHNLLVHYSGQGRPFTREILTMALDCVRQTKVRSNIGVILRHHPKKLPDDAMNAIEAHIAAFRMEYPDALVMTTLTSDQAAAICDVTFTCFGSALNFAAVHRHIPVCVMTPGCTHDLLEQTGFSETPLAAMGAAIALVEPRPLDDLLGLNTSLYRAQQRYAEPRPLDPYVAASLIENITIKHRKP